MNSATNAARYRVPLLAAALLLLLTTASSTTAASSTTKAWAYTEWSEPVNLGPVINTAFLEAGPVLSPDGL